MALTLMAVHAHPDDEAISTGGVLARYGGEGVETVLVTCTNGELGDGPGGVKPGEPGHTPGAVARLRREELAASCRALGISHLELLGYHDSGMMGWPQNDAPEAFWHADAGEAAQRLGALMERYRPQVVITYDERGFYGHPDHIQAHRVTMAAAAATGVPSKVYFPAITRSALEQLPALLREHGLEPPEELATADFATPDDRIAALVDCSAVADRKYDSLAAHRSQAENIFFLGLGRAVFRAAFGTEAFVRAGGPAGSAPPEADLFAGLR